MKNRPLSARPGVSYKIRPGKRDRYGNVQLCKLAAKTGEGLKPSSSAAEEGEIQQNPGFEAVLVEDGVCVVVLNAGQKLTFTGKCSLTCLYGSVQVFGFTIYQDQTTCELFSPNTQSPLTIEGLMNKRTSKTRKEIRMEARALLRGHLPLDARRTLMQSFKSSSSILLLERLEDTMTSYILSHPDFSTVFSSKAKEKSSTLLDNLVLHSVGIENCDPECGIKISEKCLVAVKEIIHACLEEDNGCPVILVCGPKNVGKSTFNRYLINQLLNHISCVGYLDCDLGQTEFTPPGCVSLLSITKPVLGPPYTHQREAYKMVYFGETSCEQDMERFIESVKYVMTSYKREEPLIINTMGWVKGFGLLLLIDLIRLLSPSHIVQILAKGGDVMEPLTPKYLQHSPGFLTKGTSRTKSKDSEFESSDEERQEHLHSIRTPTDQHLFTVETDFIGAGETSRVRCHSGLLRDLSMLGYLSKLQQFDLEQIVPLNCLLPYEVPFKRVALRIVHSEVAPSHIMYSINASWIGLCRILDDISSEGDGPIILKQTPVCDCLGFGIVRGVNMENKVYHILTPVPPESLRLVNCLLIGNISIPHSVLKNQLGIKGEIPYVTSEYDFTISGAGKMKINKQLKRREHKK
ncbi:polynucleotide 5'-hydroxyl-kinase NOL9 [Bombina bombina]|uniref:polynucleotide 5'-hydroxyl-kinase NOL9 n=1 Tax=Bombina bombina TaxID=8345 RepID=UPI00235AA3A4|nr:polynucleotide 5'-hydroxyl-kinase NOL9 [Bombina bombina]